MTIHAFCCIKESKHEFYFKKIYLINFIIIGARWKNVDRWIAGRFAKTSELTARLAAQLAHIDITYNLLQDFLLQNSLTNANGPVSFNTYCALMKFFYEKFPPYNEKPIIISSEYLITVPVLKSVKQKIFVFSIKKNLFRFSIFF